MFSPAGLEKAGCPEFYSCEKVDSENNHMSLKEDLSFRWNCSPGNTMIIALGDPEVVENRSRDFQFLSMSKLFK